jgi:hypothetical protein
MGLTFILIEIAASVAFGRWKAPGLFETRNGTELAVVVCQKRE